jgi:hypothetical protein
MGTLFGHLALKFTSQRENLATEALCFIVRSSDTAKEALRGVFSRAGVEIPADLRWETQVGGDDDARPDLVGFDGTGTQRVLIEAKFWAGLTDKQPVVYLKRLPAGGTLCVVGPARRHLLLVTELKRKILEPKEALSYDEVSSSHETTVARVGDRNLVVLSWRGVLATIIAAAEQASEGTVAEDARQLQGLCDHEDSEAFLPVSTEELTAHGSYQRILQFCDLVDKLATQLEDHHLIDRKGLKAVAGKGYYGRYMRLRGVGVLLLCDIRKWAAYASTPLWLSVQGPTFKEAAQAHEILASLGHETPKRMYAARDGYPAVPLFVPNGVEEGAVLNALFGQIVEVGNVIAPLARSSGEQANAQPAASPEEAETNVGEQG